jgi:hypothetical protein
VVSTGAGEVISDLKPYPATKDSGVPWLKEVPEHWVEKRTKYFYREVDERPTTGEEELMSVETGPAIFSDHWRCSVNARLGREPRGSIGSPSCVTIGDIRSPPLAVFPTKETIKKDYYDHTGEAMANFHIGIDCPGEEAAQAVHAFIESVDLYQADLDVDEERVSLVSTQGLLEELKKYASKNSVELSLEVWPEGQDFDEAEGSGDIEFFEYK